MFKGLLIAAVLALTPAAALADQNAYCAGFAAGWRAAFENHHKLVQITPICPIPPVGRDTFEGGFEAGMLAALARM